MTRKHFEAIAQAMKNARPHNENGPWKYAIDHASMELADKLKQFNSNFDKERFLTACGVK